ncbi:hypothetical protein GT037_007530 [Alternaria burnsii]|uniref:Uncharacterized protein n=1 Tax=Alternaria burnsii TaxID=1187904 RepID=A0A8H7ECL2_9PLEO|nr:uncharacterized protein GT037_007530 [Alternaria burnsii]KAF7674770.1 hypothetical protein GT037_007530 [Alternaria burnsii]
MSGSQANQPSRSDGQPSSQNPYNAPRHGRIPSRTGIELLSPPHFSQPPLPGHRIPPTVHHLREDVPTPLQRWNGESVTPFMRWAYTVRDNSRQARPNYNYDPDMNNAIFLSETIDDFDRNPALIHELILRIADPELGHASMDWIRQNRSLVDILLYRHYQQYGGLMLPPTAPPIQAMRSHETAVKSARSAGATPDQLPHISFPSFGPPPDDSVPNAPGQKGKAPVPDSSPIGNPWGSIGDRRRFGGGRGGGASGGGVAI